MLVVALLSFAPMAMAQDLSPEVQIDLAMAALERAILAENDADILERIDALRDLAPELAGGELLFFEAEALAGQGDIEAAEQALSRFLSEVGQQSASYQDALALMLDLQALLDQQSALQAGIEAFEDRRFAEALRLLQPFADSGDADAQYYLAKMHAEGSGASVDTEEAIRLYRLSADQGFADAQYALGVMYISGEGVEADPAQGIEWFNAAVEQGHPGAQQALGNEYVNGRNLERDYRKAVRLYHLAAEAGHAAAQGSLGMAYMGGVGLTQNYSMARRWLQMGADQGDPEAILSLGKMYEAGLGVPRDVDRAVSLYRRLPDDLDWVDTVISRLQGHIETFGDWHLAETTAYCIISSYVISATRQPNIHYTSMTIIAHKNGRDSNVNFSMAGPKWFDSSRPVTAYVDGREFPLDPSGVLVRPVNSNVVKAIRAGQSFRIVGSDAFTGGTITITYSAAGFTRAFNTMAERCNRMDILAWIN
ncbi:MAG: hypothetical protein RLP98_14410 [Devosia sp.]